MASDEFVEAARRLARSVGHELDCPCIPSLREHRGIPGCTCNRFPEQATALLELNRLLREYELLLNDPAVQVQEMFAELPYRLQPTSLK